jgi:hypothetical protein
LYGNRWVEVCTRQFLEYIEAARPVGTVAAPVPN